MSNLFSRLSNGISFSRIVFILWIFSIHYLQLPWFHRFTNGFNYDVAVNNINLAWINAASQATFIDRAFLWISYFGSNGNFSFFILSGFSLWFSLKMKPAFLLGKYFESRFYKTYIPYAICVLISYYISVKLLLYIPHENDLIGLLIGGAGLSSDLRYYNSPLWFLTQLFIFYLMFPFIVMIYKKFKEIGLLVFFMISLPFFYINNVNLFCCILGIFLMEVVYVFLCKLSNYKLKNYFAHIDVALIILSCLGFFYYSYIKIPIEQNIPVFSSPEMAVCAVVFTLSAGMLFPIGGKLQVIIRLVSRGTFAVYLYHYLPVHIFTTREWSPIFDFFMKYIPKIIFNHISITFIALFFLILTICSIYQFYLDKITNFLIKTTAKRIG